MPAASVMLTLIRPGWDHDAGKRRCCKGNAHKGREDEVEEAVRGKISAAVSNS